MPHLTRAAQALLNEIARHDPAGGALAAYTSYGRYRFGSSSRDWNRETFRRLFRLDLISGWDSHTDPIRLTDAGRCAHADITVQQQAKKDKAQVPPDPEGPAAQRALREV